MMLQDVIERISDDFQSTFTLINEITMANMLGLPGDFEQVTEIIHQYMPQVKVKFYKTNQFPSEYDVYIISVDEVGNG